MDLKQQVKNLREDLNMANIDSDRKSVALLTKVHLCTSAFMSLCIYVHNEETGSLIFGIITEKRGRERHRSVIDSVWSN